ncbi:MAG: PLP-dependent transferase [Pirellulaceae bacterium]|nr:PLP-dependent transferase [Pirellulaceae bacterium]
MTVYDDLGVPTIINAVGYATRVAGSCPHEEVIAAMADASRSYVEIDALEVAASELITKCTGAEAGLITCGASASLALAAAACLCGNDPDRMDALPDTSDFSRNEIVFPKPGPFDYDHPFRASGAKLVTIDYADDDAPDQIAAAVNAHTAAIAYVWLGIDERPSIEWLVRLSQEHGLPLIVDGAMSLPPRENLHRFIDLGADLVAISGGKHLGGPQASGILAGREELIRSAWLQMVDMDVRPETWSLKRFVDDGWVDRAPGHGIGRSMKVSKEQIVGLMTALQRYSERDHDAELRTWHSYIDTVMDGLQEVEVLQPRKLFPSPNGQPWPLLELHADGALRRRLRERNLILAESDTDPEIAFVNPICLRKDDPAKIVKLLREEVD